MKIKRGGILLVILGGIVLSGGILLRESQLSPATPMIAASNTLVITPTWAVGQSVTLSGRISQLIVDFTGQPDAFYLTDEAGNRVQLETPLPSYPAGYRAGVEVTIVGIVISTAHPQTVSHPAIYAVVKVDTIR